MKTILIFISMLAMSGLQAQTNGDYRSIASGDWNVVSNWERFDGAIWQPAAIAPANTDGTITITNANTITATTAVTADQLIVDAGAALVISSAFVVADVAGTDLTVNGTLQVAANLSGPGSTLINGTMAWTAGTLSTPATIAAAATLTISSTSAKALNSSIVNNGSIDWNAGNIDFTNGSITNNNSFINSFDGNLNNASGVNSFSNTGSFEKSGGSSTNTTIAIPMTNSGSIAVNSGTLNKSIGSLTLNAGTVLTGTGTFSFSSNVIFNTALNIPSSLTISQLTGSSTTGTGPYTINGTMSWTGGAVSSSCIVAAGGVVNASTTSTKTIYNGTVTNNGTINWSLGAISLNSTGTLNNNGSFNMTGDNPMNGGVLGTNAFNNAGTLTKSVTTGTSGLNAPIYNSGTIQVATGIISTSNVLVLNPGTVLTGNGTFGIDGAVTVNTAVSPPSTLLIRKNGGSTTGTGTFTILGTMNWTTGSIGSPFHIQSGAVLSMPSGTSRAINSTLTNDGTINWSLGYIDFNSGTLNNNGTVNNNTDNFLNNTSGTNLLNNTGVFNKSLGSGTSTIAIPFTNTGTVNVNTGTLVNASSSFENYASVNITAPRTFSNTGTIMLRGGTVFTTSGTGAAIFSNSGVVDITTNVALPSGITFNMLAGSSSSGTGTMTIIGIMNWSGGSVGSPFIIAPTATVNASGATKSLNSTLTNNGSISWTAGNIECNNGNLTNTGTLNHSFDGTLVNASGVNAFSNSGTFSKTAGTTSTVAIPATNTGIINGGNTIAFTEAFTNNGTIAPGRPMGILTIAPAVSPVLTGSSTLGVEMLDGSGAGTGHDQLLQHADLVLAGTLTVTETGVIPAGDYIIVSLSAGTISGSFSVVSVPASYIVIYNSNNVILRKTLLPLNWLSFTGNMKHNSVMLNWATANERNTKAFELQRSIDGRHFVAIAKLKAKAGLEDKAYAFEDFEYAEGLNYYRVKQIDVDDAFEYSKTIAVRAGITAGDIRIFPNPAKGSVTMQIPEVWSSSDIKISTLSGQLIREYKKVNQGSLQLQLTQGVYFVQFNKGNRSTSKQIRID